jgi:hypothetical protein
MGMTGISTTVTAGATETRSGGRFARAGSLTGLLGAICCVGNAVAVATGLGALSFFGVWMDRYQLYFIGASLGAMALMLGWLIRRSGLRSAKRVILRHAAVMAVAYVVTFAVATIVSGLIAG